jgi:hypothetical protein
MCGRDADQEQAEGIFCAGRKCCREVGSPETLLRFPACGSCPAIGCPWALSPCCVWTSAEYTHSRVQISLLLHTVLFKCCLQESKSDVYTVCKQSLVFLRVKLETLTFILLRCMTTLQNPWMRRKALSEETKRMRYYNVFTAKDFCLAYWWSLVSSSSHNPTTVTCSKLSTDSCLMLSSLMSPAFISGLISPCFLTEILYAFLVSLVGLCFPPILFLSLALVTHSPSLYFGWYGIEWCTMNWELLRRKG